MTENGGVGRSTDSKKMDNLMKHLTDFAEQSKTCLSVFSMSPNIHTSTSITVLWKPDTTLYH